jgi:3-hydroxy-9,10-secoandrosta-1,3,5(10)-triene-9,17-dione monooxygenase
MAGDGRTSDAGSPAALGSDSHAAMVARARALIPELRNRAARTEELRRLPPQTERFA